MHEQGSPSPAVLSLSFLCAVVVSCATSTSTGAPENAEEVTIEITTSCWTAPSLVRDIVAAAYLRCGTCERDSDCDLVIDEIGCAGVGPLVVSKGNWTTRCLADVRRVIDQYCDACGFFSSSIQYAPDRYEPRCVGGHCVFARRGDDTMPGSDKCRGGSVAAGESRLRFCTCVDCR
jgi:hypothetical protein